MVGRVGGASDADEDLLAVARPLPDAETRLQQLVIATEFTQAFLAACCDPSAGAALYDLLAPDAPVFRSGAWQPKHQETALAFAETHRQLHARGVAALPTFVAVQAISSTVMPESEAGVIWFAARESRSASPLLGALGVQTRGDWRVMWATLVDHQYDWSFADGLVRTLANLSWMELCEPALARTSLDASYFRLHWLTESELTWLPETRFSCRQTSTCCRQDYQIVVPAAAQSLVDALPWERLAPHLRGTQLHSLGDGKVEVKNRSEACRFPGAQNQCLIHAELGYQPFGPCAAFPFSFAATPEGMAVTASLACGSVCQSYGDRLDQRDIDIRQRLAITPVRSTTNYRLCADKEIDWRMFKEAESLLLGLLDHTAIPLHRRLYLGVRSLAALQAGEAIRLNACLTEPPAYIDTELRQQIGSLLDNIMAWDRIAFAGLPKTAPRDLKHDELVDAPRLTSILRTLHFSKVYSYEYDLVTAHNLAIVVYLLALSWQRAGNGALDNLRWRELAILGSHGLLKSMLPAHVPQAYRDLLGSSQFGEWALAYAV